MFVFLCPNIKSLVWFMNDNNSSSFMQIIDVSEECHMLVE